MTLNAIEHIERKVQSLERKYGTTDPYELADWLDCIVDFEDYPQLLGFCNIIMGVRVIGLNSKADYYTRRCACAHELGHLALGHARKSGFQPCRAADFSNITARYEAEANCFAATLLMGDAETLEVIRTYDDAARCAASLYVCPELFEAKIRILNAKGHHFNIHMQASDDAWKQYIRRACNW